MGVPIQAARGGCAVGDAAGSGGSFRSCNRRVVATGLYWFPHSREAWQVFLCDEHLELAAHVRDLTEEDLQELEWRREQHRLGLDGRRFEEAQPLWRGARPDWSTV